MSISEFLSWVMNSGGAAILVSKILELIPAFHTLQATTRWWINLVAVLLFTAGFYAIQMYVPADVLAQIDPWFKLVSGVIITYAGQQLVFKSSRS